MILNCEIYPHKMKMRNLTDKNSSKIIGCVNEGCKKDLVICFFLFLNLVLSCGF